MSNSPKPVYEVETEYVKTTYGAALEFAKIAIYGFDTQSSRFAQIEEALDEIYIERTKTKITRLRREDYSRIMDRHELPRPNATSNGLLWRATEVRYIGDKKRSLID